MELPHARQNKKRTKKNRRREDQESIFARTLQQHSTE